MGKYTQAEIDKLIDEAAERAVGFYYEKMQDDFERTHESTTFIKEQLDQQVDQQEFEDLTADVDINRLAVIETNKDVGRLKVRVNKLENA
ncbi:hypothetical protein COY17_00575 [Candidatus Saccharibacteria bacterium CG_4_10_14_0_2_um_filter_52_9]|nr:MAG: hypothetical protein COY17_00575 [Candidatus Saccharibacteria bacterium CG_4_10_14_0_2_um_filter_52_9]